MKAVNIYLDNEQVEFEISYKNWLIQTFSEPSEAEINEMERDFYKSLTERNTIIAHKPLNNPNYQPYQGA